MLCSKDDQILTILDEENKNESSIHPIDNIKDKIKLEILLCVTQKRNVKFQKFHK